MIRIDEEKRLFDLCTRHTAYQMKADGYGVLLHTYYGPLSGLDGDMSRLIGRADRGFSPNPPDAGEDRTYSLDTLPQEYPGWGTGDLRLPCIQVELADGSAVADLRFTGFERQAGKYALDGLPAFHGEGWETLVIRMEDPVSHLRAALYYAVQEEYDLITRAVRVDNAGASPVRLRQAASACLDLQRADMDLITFDGCHMMERAPSRGALRPGVQAVGSVRGTSSHQHNPFVILCEPGADEDGGLCYGAMLVYSGNFEAAVERSQFETARLVLGINPRGSCFSLAPGEGFTAPEAALICSPDGLGPMSRRLHKAIRNCLVRDPWAGRRRPILLNSWEAAYFDFDAEKLLSIAGEAAALGVELFVLDDGWFGHRDSDDSSLGDWYAYEKKLPGGLKALAGKINDLGMDFGIWIEPEMVSQDSGLYRAHPDWVLAPAGRDPVRGRGQLVLDFTRQDVRDCVFDQLAAALEGVKLAYIKWDMNRSLTGAWSAALSADRQGEVYHRYVLGVYELLERVRAAWPEALIEGCSGGGGRFDAGMLYYTPQIWCSDNNDAIDRLRIQYGTSFAYPVSAMGAHVAPSPSHGNGRVTPIMTRGVVALSGTFGYELDPRTLTDGEKQAVRELNGIYKARWELLHNGDYYRLTDPFRNGPYTAWEQVSPDRDTALVSVVFTACRANHPFYALRLKGLDPAARYRVDGVETYTGGALMAAGLPLPMPWGDYGALLYCLERVNG